MAFDFKSATPDTSFSTAYLFGADSQSATDPSIYAVSVIWSYLKGLNDITGLGTITTGVWNGTAIGVAYGGTNIASYTAGDMLYASGATTLAKLGIGSANTILTSSGSAPQWSTASTVTGLLSNFVGDSGSGGTKGLVPAPSAGDAAASKYLKADGTWATVSGSGASWGTVAGGTVTSDTPYTFTQTWNSGGVTFNGVSIDITNTTSAAASRPFRVRVGGTSIFNVSPTGTTMVGTQTDPGFSSGSFGAQNTIFAPEVRARTGLGNIVILDANGCSISSAATSGLRWMSGDAGGGTPSSCIFLDTTNALGQRNGTSAQTKSVYDTYASSTDYHRVSIKTARATLASVSGATVTATGLIPDGAVVVGVTSKVTVSLGTGGGTTGYQIGDGTDADRWGAITGTTAGTSSDNRDWTATTVQAFTTATDVVVTATGGNFNGTGTIYLSVQYLTGECD